MIICICHRVSDRDMARAVRQGGCTRFEDLQRSLGVATSCGACRDCARQTFEALVTSAADADPSAAPGTPTARGRVPALAAVAQPGPAPGVCPGALSRTDGPAPAGRWTPGLPAGA